MCTFENCSAHLFQSLREWARHELENHQREWRCNLCSLEHFKSAKSLDDHMRDQHSTYTRKQTSSMQSLSEQYPQVVPMSACAFCDWPVIYKEAGTSHPASEVSADLSTDSPSRVPPFAKKHGLSGLPTACPIVPIEQFQKHVGHHLEQLALFALPPPIKESSQTSSNLVAISHPSRGSDDESVSKTSAHSPTSVNSDPLPDLYVALTRGDVDLVEKLLQCGADANVRGPDGAGLLQVAAVFGVLEALAILLKAGADPNARGGEYGNALQAIAAYDGLKLNALDLMLSAGADIDLQGGKFGHALVAAAATELHPAVEVSEPTWQVIRLLLEFGANPNAAGGRSGTALGASVARKDYRSVQELLENGADINAYLNDWGSVLQIASWDGDVQMVRMLLDNGANINAQGGSYDNALQAASAGGYSQVVKILLDRGADVNALGGHYSSDIQAATAEGHSEVVQMLLEPQSKVLAPSNPPPPGESTIQAAEKARKAKEEEDKILAIEAEYAEMERQMAEHEDEYQRNKKAKQEEVARKEAEALKMLDEDMKRAEREARECEEARLKNLKSLKATTPRKSELRQMARTQVHTTQEPERPSSPVNFHHWTPPDSQNKSKGEDDYQLATERHSSQNLEEDY